MISLQGIHKTFTSRNQEVEALSNIHLTIEAGEIFGLIGYSGAGKSTLLRCINLLEAPSRGSVVVDGTDMQSLSKGQLQQQRRKIGMIFQHFNLLHSATVTENIAFPLKLVGMSAADIKRRVDELLGLVGLAGYGRKYPAELSGGQKQRVAIARALANEPKVLLCDEATSALDPQTTRSILDLLLEINQRLNLTLVVVTHEMAVVKRICDRVAVMEAGHIVEEGSVAELFLHPKHHVTQGLLEIHPPEADTLDEAPLPENFATDELEELQAPESSVLLHVAYSGDLTFAPVLAEVAQQTNTTFSILQGTVDAVKGVPYGRLTVRWFGGKLVQDKVLQQLQNRGCYVAVVPSEGRKSNGQSRVV